MPDNEWFVKFVEKELREIKECIKEMPGIIERKYITRQEFTPVRLIVYGIAGISLTMLLVGLIVKVLGK